MVTNPDMLHAGILPHHTRWVKLFENLEYIVIDETAHLPRRVRKPSGQRAAPPDCACARSTAADPRFILCSATIANPVELASSAHRAAKSPPGRPKTARPSGERHVVFYNPPVVNRQLGIRQSAVVNEVRRIAAGLFRNGIPTIVLCKSRTHGGGASPELPQGHARAYRLRLFASRVRGYRGGYLPSERREIEQRPAEAGEVDMVVVPPTRWSWASTSAPSRRACCAAIPAPSPAPGSRRAAPDGARTRR